MLSPVPPPPPPGFFASSVQIFGGTEPWASDRVHRFQELQQVRSEQLETTKKLAELKEAAVKSSSGPTFREENSVPPVGLLPFLCWGRVPLLK